MGLFDFLKNTKSQPTTIKSGEERISKIVKEIAKCYSDFFTDMARPLYECIDRNARAIRIGSEIPMMAYFDFENFSNLLFNNMKLEIKDKNSIFLQEQSTFYVLFSDRYLFSKLGNEGRNQVMDVLECAYLNTMMNYTNHNEAAWHMYKEHILVREKETSQYESMDRFFTVYQSNLIHMLGLDKDYISVRFLLDQIINAGTMMFALKMLSTLEVAILISKEEKLAASNSQSVATVMEIRRDGLFIAYNNGTVLDTKTNLMWAAKDNGANINWADAKKYCENYRGGGYADWRMPTAEELIGLYDANKSRPLACNKAYSIHVATDLIDITCFNPWTSETTNTLAASITYHDGIKRNNYLQTSTGGFRALPVRSGK